MLSAFLDGLLRLLGLKKPKKVLLSQRIFEQCNHPLRPVLDERYLAMRAAMAGGDGAAIAALLTPDFTSVNVDGIAISAQQMIDNVVGLTIDRSKRTAVTTLVDIEEDGNLVRVLQHYSMTSHPDAPASMPKFVQALSLDTWKSAGGTWLLRRTETLESEVLAAAGQHRYRARIELGSVELTNAR